MNFAEKAAYLKGLAEGLKLDTEKAEGRLISELIELTAGMAAELEELRDLTEELDMDLGEVEEAMIYDDDDDEDDDPCDGCCGCDGDEELYEDDMRCAMCPKCGDAVYFEEDADPEKIVCPSCGASLYENNGDK